MTFKLYYVSFTCFYHDLHECGYFFASTPREAGQKALIRFVPEWGEGHLDEGSSTEEPSGTKTTFRAYAGSEISDIVTVQESPMSPSMRKFRWWLEKEFAKPEDINYFVYEWHEDTVNEEFIHEYLGLTFEEYRHWVETNEIKLQ